MAKIEDLADRVVDTDILVIGSEGAGSRAVIEACKENLSVTVVTKGYVGKSGATVTGDADIDVDGKSAAEIFGFKQGLGDSPEKFFEDMVKEGKYLNDQPLVEIHTREAAATVKDLLDWGAKFQELFHAPGHSYPRGLIISGPELADVLTKALLKQKATVIEHMMITDLIISNGRAAGAVGLCFRTGEFFLIKAKAVIMGTGGPLRIYPHTTAPEELTGDGIAMVYRADVELVDMEFPMFLPYTMIYPPAVDGVDYPFILSFRLDAHALNRKGERYMNKWDPARLERTTRDVNSIAAMVEVLEGRGSPHGGTYLSFKHLPNNLIEYHAKWFPAHHRNWTYGKLNMREFLPDLGKDAVETAPSCHFHNGGIKINERCETNIGGLFAGGEGTGSIHGANRISGNALTMTQVWGVRAGRYAAQYAAKAKQADIDPDVVERLKKNIFEPFNRNQGENPIALRKRIQKIAGEKVGVIRNKEGLEQALAEIDDMRKNRLPKLFVTGRSKVYNRQWLEAIQNENMLQCLEIIARAALMRTESRGAHYRTDYIKTDNQNWLKNIIVKQANGEMKLSARPAAITKMKPPMGIFDYAEMAR